MSCIRFNTPTQRAQLAADAPTMRTADDIAAHYRSPEWTAGKLERLRLLAKHENPKIRERVAADLRAPADVIAKLAKDSDVGVRVWVARNESVSCDVLRELATDESEIVRGFVAVNYQVPDDVMASLADDSSETVRGLVAWKTRLRSEELVEA